MAFLSSTLALLLLAGLRDLNILLALLVLRATRFLLDRCGNNPPPLTLGLADGDY
jgi:hypothetical protein